MRERASRQVGWGVDKKRRCASILHRQARERDSGHRRLKKQTIEEAAQSAQQWLRVKEVQEGVACTAARPAPPRGRARAQSFEINAQGVFPTH